jgi:hypothetical protein
MKTAEIVRKNMPGLLGVSEVTLLAKIENIKHKILERIYDTQCSLWIELRTVKVH